MHDVCHKATFPDVTARETFSFLSIIKTRKRGYHVPFKGNCIETNMAQGFIMTIFALTTMHTHAH
jgi:hypothetical protein